MRPKKINQKLSLNKQTVMNLDKLQMNSAKGGASVAPLTCGICDTVFMSCVETRCEICMSIPNTACDLCLP